MGFAVRSGHASSPNLGRPQGRLVATPAGDRQRRQVGIGANGERNLLKIQGHGSLGLVIPIPLQHFSRHGSVVKIDGFVFQYLIGFVALARKYDDIAFARFLQSLADGGLPVAPSPVRPKGSAITAGWQQLPFETPRELGLRAAVGVPVIVEGRLWGVMVVGSRLTESVPADTEARLAQSSMQVCIVRPDAFQDIHLAPVGRFDVATGKVAIFGRGDTPRRWVAGRSGRCRAGHT